MKVGLLAMFGMLWMMVVVCDGAFVFPGRPGGDATVRSKDEIERLVKTLRYFDSLKQMKPVHVEDNSERNKFQPW